MMMPYTSFLKNHNFMTSDGSLKIEKKFSPIKGVIDIVAPTGSVHFCHVKSCELAQRVR